MSEHGPMVGHAGAGAQLLPQMERALSYMNLSCNQIWPQESP